MFKSKFKEPLTLRFYKEKKEWYADIPEYLETGGRKSDLVMVEGADSFLEFLSQDGKEVTLQISSKPFKGSKIKMIKESSIKKNGNMAYTTDSDLDHGVYYLVTEMDSNIAGHRFWLCPVTKFVFGDFPEEIYAVVV